MPCANRSLPLCSALVCIGLIVLALSRAPAAEPRVQLTSLPDRVRIEVDGYLFTEYRFRDTPKPFLHPIRMADGTALTRGYPMQDTPGEERDHPHHRSLWFAHGAVNGVDFWTEGPSRGTIVHDALLEASSGAAGVLRARHRWLAPDGRELCTDETTVRVTPAAHGRLLDFDVTLQAPASHALTFGDTKEGTMALRLAGWLVMTHQVKRQTVPGVGHAVNSAGDRDTAAWGRRAAWVDYFAPRGEKTYGAAIFDHPDNPHHPTWWHVRDYGLFAANPFGQHDFESLKDRPRAGEWVVPAGSRVTFRYRFYFHEGDTTAADVPGHYRDYTRLR
ncbi:MAG TPA: PmoA family protein [Opitutaceae bacterium]